MIYRREYTCFGGAEDNLVFPRKKAVRVLTRVLSDRQSLEDALAVATQDCSPEEAGWLQEICSGTLRWRGRLDFVLDSIALKKKPTGWLRKILLLACYQLIVQDRVHPGAVVSETVSEIKLIEGEAPARFANACLRKVADHASQWRTLAFPVGKNAPSATTPTAYAAQAAWASLPLWLWKKLVKQQGQEWAVAFAQASLQRPTLWVRTKSSTSDLAGESDLGFARGPVPGAWQVTGRTATQVPGFSAGEILVQDISSQTLISEVCADLVWHFTNNCSGSALDLCAAPGGKAVGLAWNGFDVTATDHSALRAQLLRQNVARLAPGIRVLPWEKIPQEEEKDLVWLDAPCSGIGIIRRHPDIRWLRDEKQLTALTQTQTDLIQLAWSKVRPGGFLVYSVCSVLAEEGPQILEKVQLERFLIRQWLLGPQIEPFGDGFWAALLHKPSQPTV